jgi:Ca-activated chloride channel family protein
MIVMADLLQLEWRAPWWSLVALQPLAVKLLMRLRRQRLLRYAEPHLLPWATRGGLKTGEDLRLRWLTGAFWLLLACALAGPRLAIDPTPDARQAATPRHEMDVMVVLDVSPSMRAQDIKPDRLARAKLKLVDLTTRLRGERVGLIAFSGQAGLVMPLTQDTHLMNYFLDQAQPDLFEEKGTDLGDALDLARTYLQAQPAASRAILLVTDADVNSLSGAAGNAALAATRALKDAHIPLFILGVGTEQGAPIPLPDGGVAEDQGNPVISRLDKSGFASLAASDGGTFAQLSDGDGDLSAVYDRGILTLPAKKRASAPGRTWRELYPFALVPALILFFLMQGQRRRWAAAIATTALLATSAQAQTNGADVAGWQDAYDAYRKGDYLLAQHLYDARAGFAARMGEGAAAYRRKDYVYAVRQFTAALLAAEGPDQRADALFNLGNSEFMAGSRTAALDAFQGVLRYRPKDEKARANLAHVTSLMRPGAARGGEGIPGRHGHGLGEGANANEEAPMGMEEEKEKPQVLVEKGAGLDDAERARTIGKGGGRTVAANAGLRAAQKKLELIQDHPRMLIKHLITQDRGDETAQDLKPW